MLIALLALLAMPSNAQLIDPLNVEPDANGVDMLSGQVSRPVPVLAIPAAPNLRLERLQLLLPVLTGSESFDETLYRGSVQLNNGSGASGSFQCIERQCWPTTNNGSTLTTIGSGTLRSYTYMQAGTGMRIVFNSVGNFLDSGATEWFSIYPSSIAYANGETLTFTYDKVAVPGGTRHRPTRVASNTGYEMQLTYQGSDVNVSGWRALAQATIYRSADTSTPLARHTYDSSGITDLAGRTWSCCGDSVDSPALVNSTSQRLPGESSDSFVATGGENQWVSSVASDDVSYTYNFVGTTVGGKCFGEFRPWSCDIEQATITGPLNFERVVVNDVPETEGLATVVSSVTNRISSTTTYTTNYSYDIHRRLTGITYPRGNGVSVIYDDHGNITSRSILPTSGSALTQTANYTTPGTPGPGLAGCRDVTCFLPNWTRDEAGNQTDYTWDQTHGGMLTRTGPAGANGYRSRTMYQYVQTNGIWRLSRERVCSVTASGGVHTCGTTTEQRTDYTYWGNTMLPATTRRSPWGNAISATTTYTYDTAGRVLSEDGPLAGTDDASYYRYDTAGRRTQVVGPDIGNAARRAGTNTTYRDADDQPILVQTGYYTSPTDLTLSATSEVLNTYNSRRLVTRSDTIDAPNDTTVAVTQFTYDARNQLDCAAVRMNPAQFTSLPGSACTLDTAGSMGPDRISRNSYDTLGRLTQTVGGYLVLNGGAGIVEIKIGYTTNGQIAWREDGNANQTNYTYDVYDRPLRTTFPDATYEELSYNSRSLPTQMRNRRGQTITNAYDNAGRVTQTSYSTSVPSINYSYDGLGRETQVDRPGRATIDYLYDDLGRRSRVTQDGRQLNYQYDIAGRRTRLTYPDGFYVTYDYTPAGAVTAIRENGGTALASYLYNAAGWLTRIDRANGEDTAITRDWLARPSQLNHIGLSATDFTYNPASQLLTRIISNDAFVWNHHVNVDRAYAVNNLNQYTSAGATTFSYDTSGNLTASGTDTFNYDPANRMTGAGVGGVNSSIYYDGLGRIERRFGGGIASTVFLHDDDALVAEYNDSGTMLRRYIHGPGVDDPIVWYEGSGTTDRRFLHADERGSIVAITDNAGVTVNINTYDDWGIPAPGNLGRFGYTGQLWIDELGLNYYKARFYSPTLGRFMQTDPIGYDDGMNMYAYVGNDPVNGTDPSGTASYLVARPVYWGAFDHLFTVVADRPGGRITAQFSYSSGGLFQNGLVAVSVAAGDSTAIDDAAAFRSLGGENSNGITYVEIDAEDTAVIAAGRAVNSALGTDPRNSPLRYDPFPMVTPPGYCNSNCAASAVANQASEEAGNGPTPVPEGSNPVGSEQEYRVRDLLQFDQNGVCRGTRINNSQSGSIC